MFKKLNDFKKRFNKFKTVNPQTDENNALKPKVLDNVGDLFNELYYIYKDKYNEERDGSNKKKQKIFLLQKNWDLLMIINMSLKKKSNRLAKWIKVSKQRFDVIKKKVQNTKTNKLQVRPKGSKVININEWSKLLHEIENSQIAYEEALKRIKNIHSDINKILVWRASTQTD